MTGIALPPVKGDVRPLYCYTSCGFALQGLMLPRTVSREGNLSDFQASKEASSPSNLFYVDSMWGKAGGGGGEVPLSWKNFVKMINFFTPPLIHIAFYTLRLTQHVLHIASTKFLE